MTLRFQHWQTAARLPTVGSRENGSRRLPVIREKMRHGPWPDTERALATEQETLTRVLWKTLAML